MPILETFKTCAKSAKAADRKALLLSADRNLVTTILSDTYDKTRTYGITTKNLNIELHGSLSIDTDYSRFHDVLDKCACRKLTGNAAIDAMTDTIQLFTEESQQLLLDIVDRNIAIGVSYDSWCKIAGIKRVKFEVPLAFHLDKAPGKPNPIDGTYFASQKMDGCVSGDTIIELENGVKLPISEVVDNRIRGKIKSYDVKTGEIVYREIENWMHNVEDLNPSQKQWYEIELKCGNKLKITGNDSLYVKDRGWVKVEDLTEDDEILVD